MKKTKAFTIIEIILAITLTSIFTLIFIELLVPIRDRLNKNISELEIYGQLLFINNLFADIVRLGDRGSTNSILFGGNYGTLVATSTAETSSGTSTKQIFLVSEIEDKKIECGLSSDELKARNNLFLDNPPYLFCSFDKSEGVMGDEILIPLVSVSKLGTSTLYIDADKYNLYLGKYILQFGLFPHIFEHENKKTN